MIGQRFSRLVVARQVDTGKRGRWYECRCDCGRTTVAISAKLRNGHKQSCGCLKDENWLGATHGMHGSPEHGVWEGIKRRCLMPSDPSFKHYGARGIGMDVRWQKDFLAFLVDVGPRPSPKHTIERINVNGHYERDNVTWVTMQEQARNKRNNRHITIAGRTMILVEWCEFYGISPKNVVARERIGWTMERALSTPVRRQSSETHSRGSVAGN